jgi:cell division inhibitor SepF
MTVWKKAMSYLGLGPDDEYAGYDEPMEPERPQRARPGYGYEEPGAVRTIPPRESGPRPTGPPEYDEPAVTVRSSRQSSAVRTVSATGTSAKPHTVRPRRFDQAQEVADKFKEGQPVIVNLQDVGSDLSRRLIDFSSGLCYGLGGTMEKVASGVYLLSPANVSVSAEDKRLAAERERYD